PTRTAHPASQQTSNTPGQPPPRTPTTTPPSVNIETHDGAATTSLELTDTAPLSDTVQIALADGAPATSAGHTVKAIAPEAEVICIQPQGAPATTHS
ncbi:hypothetical protein ABZZ80_08415, partial [Streptomyces sp. NPDC006356]